MARKIEELVFEALAAIGVTISSDPDRAMEYQGKPLRVSWFRAVGGDDGSGASFAPISHADAGPQLALSLFGEVIRAVSEIPSEAEREVEQGETQVFLDLSRITRELRPEVRARVGALRWYVSPARCCTGAGRTTAMAVAVLQEAIANPGQEVFFMDHYRLAGFRAARGDDPIRLALGSIARQYEAIGRRLSILPDRVIYTGTPREKATR